MAEYQIGDGIQTTSVITQKDICEFAELTGDLNPIHIDDEYASSTRFGKTIAHGILVAGSISKTIGIDYPGVGTVYLEQNLKFCSPVFPGDELTTSVTVLEIINRDKKILKLDTNVKNQEGVSVIEGYAIVMAP